MQGYCLARRRKTKSNPQLYYTGITNPHEHKMPIKGKIPNLTMCESDGFVRLNFKKIRLDKNFDLNAYANGVFDEIRRALKGIANDKTYLYNRILFE